MAPKKILQKISDHLYVVQWTDKTTKVVNIQHMKHYVPNRFSKPSDNSVKIPEADRNQSTKEKVLISTKDSLPTTDSGIRNTEEQFEAGHLVFDHRPYTQDPALNQVPGDQLPVLPDIIEPNVPMNQEPQIQRDVQVHDPQYVPQPQPQNVIAPRIENKENNLEPKRQIQPQLRRSTRVRRLPRRFHEFILHMIRAKGMF